MGISPPLARTLIPTFDQLVSPISTENFLRDIFGKVPLYIPGDKDRFKHLLTWDDLNSILGAHPSDGLHMRIVKDGQSIAAEQYLNAVNIEFLGNQRQVDVNRFTKLLREGATLTLDLYRGIHEPLRLLADMLQRVLYSRVHVVVIAGWHSSRCFDTHWDPTDIFVLQLVGKKRWRVFEPVRKHPTHEDKKLKINPPDSSYWEGDLNAGDLLHVPRGWWHDAMPYSTPSLHVTLAVCPVTGMDLVRAMFRNLNQHEIMRANVPRYMTKAQRRDYVAHLRDVVVRATDTSLNDTLAELDSKLPLRSKLSLPWSAVPEAQSIPVSARIEWLSIHPAKIEETDEGLKVDTLVSTITLPRFVVPVLMDLIERNTVTMEELCSRHPGLNIAACILELLPSGLVSISGSAEALTAE